MIGDDEVFVSVVQLAEVAEWAVRNKVSVKERVAAVKEFARVVPPDEQICLNAAEIKADRRQKDALISVFLMPLSSHLHA